MIKYVIKIFVIFLPVIFFACSFFAEHDNYGSICIEFDSGKNIQKRVMQSDSVVDLRMAECYILREGHVLYHKNLEKHDNMFVSKIEDLEVGNGYSVWLYGFGSSSKCYVSSFKSGVSISQGRVTNILMSWTRFLTELIYPEKEQKIDTNFVRFAWRKVPCATEYFFEVDNDSMFVSPVISKNLSDTTYTWNFNNVKGGFFWRVICQYNGGEGFWTERGYFSIKTDQ